MHKHALASHHDTLTLPDGSTHQGTPYNMRRLACETGVAAIAKHHPHVKALRDATLPMLEQARPLLTDLIERRCRHVITENTRCEQFGPLLRAGQYEQAGELMVQSHRSLQHDYHVSVEPLDRLVDFAGPARRGASVRAIYPRRLQSLLRQRRADHRHDGYRGCAGGVSEIKGV
jgi:galactokinase